MQDSENSLLSFELFSLAQNMNTRSMLCKPGTASSRNESLTP